MSITARQIITNALRIDRVYESGEPLTDYEADDGLRSLNSMLGSWDTQDLTTYFRREINHSLTSGTGAYTIGKGGDFYETTGTAQDGDDNTITLAATESAIDGEWESFDIVLTGGTGSGQRKTINSYTGSTKVAIVDSDWDTNPDNTTVYEIECKRPDSIKYAFIRDANSTDSPVCLLDNMEYSTITNKSTTGGYPTHLYYRPNYPLGEINLYPIPGSGLTLYLQVRDSLTPFRTLDSLVSMPSGYERAITYNLAVDIAPEYGATPRADVMQIARESLGNIKNVNTRTPRMVGNLPIGGDMSKQGFFPG